VRKTGLGPPVLDEAACDGAIAITYDDPAAAVVVKAMAADRPSGRIRHSTSRKSPNYGR